MSAITVCTQLSQLITENLPQINSNWI